MKHLSSTLNKQNCWTSTRWTQSERPPGFLVNTAHSATPQGHLPYQELQQMFDIDLHQHISCVFVNEKLHAKHLPGIYLPAHICRQKLSHSHKSYLAVTTHHLGGKREELQQRLSRCHRSWNRRRRIWTSEHAQRSKSSKASHFLFTFSFEQGWKSGSQPGLQPCSN